MCALGVMSPLAIAQSTEIKIGDAVVSSSLRSRMYSWDWFGDTPNGEYTYSGSLLRFGVTESKPEIRLASRVRRAGARQHADERRDAGAARQLGLGGELCRRQQRLDQLVEHLPETGRTSIKGIGGIAGQSIKAGRMEFIDGSELAPAHSTLAALKRDRIAQRLLANFGWTDVQRSLDGAQYVLDTPKLNVTAVAAPPDRGRLSGRRLGRTEDQCLLWRGHRTARQVRRDRLASVRARLQRLPQRRREDRQPRRRDQKCRLPTRSTSALTAAMSSRSCRRRPARSTSSSGARSERLVGHAVAPRRRVCRRSWMAAGRAEADQAVDTRRLRLRVGRRQRGRRHALDVLPGAADAPHLRADAVLQHDEQQGRLRRADPPAEARHGPLRHSRAAARRPGRPLVLGRRGVPGNDLRLHRPAVEWPVHARYALRRQRRRHAHSARRRRRLRRLRGRRASDAGDLYQR